MNGYNETQPQNETELQVITPAPETDTNINSLAILDNREAALIALRDKYSGMKINGIEDREGYKAVRAARLELKGERVQVKKDGEALRERAVQFAKKVIGREKELIAIIARTEDELAAEEQRIDEERERLRIQKEREEQEALQKRIDALAKFGYAEDLYTLSIMPEEDFQALLGHAEGEYLKEQERIAAEKAEQERQRREEEERRQLEREQLEQARREQERKEEEIRIEVERLRKLEKRIAKEQKEREDAIRKEQERKEAELRTMREELEKEKNRIAEENRLEQARAEAAERARIEEQERIKREAEEKELAAQRAEIEAKRQEALKPDKEKLIAFARRISEIEPPLLNTVEAINLSGEAIDLLTKASELLIEKSQKI